MQRLVASQQTFKKLCLRLQQLFIGSFCTPQHHQLQVHCIAGRAVRCIAQGQQLPGCCIAVVCVAVACIAVAASAVHSLAAGSVQYCPQHSPCRARAWSAAVHCLHQPKPCSAASNEHSNKTATAAATTATHGSRAGLGTAQQLQHGQQCACVHCLSGS